jgi:hypothetical protein
MATQKQIDMEKELAAAIAKGMAIANDSTASTKELKAAQLELYKVQSRAKKVLAVNNTALGKASRLYSHLGRESVALSRANNKSTVSFKSLTLAALGLGVIVKKFSLIKVAHDKYILPIDKLNADLAKSFGDVRDEAGKFENSIGGRTAKTASNMSSHILGLKNSINGMKSPLKYLSPGFKGVEENQLDLIDTTKSLSSVLSALPGQFTETAESTLIFKKVLGASNEDLAGFSTQAISLGTTVAHQMAAAAAASKKMAGKFGVDQKTLSKNVHVLRKDFGNFATASEESLAKTAAAAQKLGISMEGISKLTVFDDFDKTADAAAQLGQSFGINIDAFELFNAESPEDRLRMLQTAAQDAGQDIASMGRIAVKHFAELTGGMGVDDVMKGYSSNNILRAQVDMDKGMSTKTSSKFEQTNELMNATGQFKGMSLAISGTANEIKQARKDVHKWFGIYINQIEKMPSSMQDKIDAIVDAGAVGQGRGEKLRNTVMDKISKTFGDGQALAGSEAFAQVMDKTLKPILNSLNVTLTQFNNVISQLGPTITAMNTADNISEDKNSTAAQVAAAAERSETQQRNIAAIAKDAIDASGRAGAKAADHLLGAIARPGLDAAKEVFGDSTVSAFLNNISNVLTVLMPESLVKAFTDAIPEFVKALQGKDFAINDAMLSPSGPPTLRGPVSSMQLASGVTVRPDPNDAFIAGRPGDIVSKYMDTT